MSDATVPGALHGAVDLSSLVRQPDDTQTQNVPAGEAVEVPSLVMDGTDSNFAQFLELSKTVPVIVDLWADWCEPCKKLSPVLERVVTSYGGRLVLVKVDVDANQQLAQAFQAQSIPTVAAILGGRPVSLFSGTMDEAQVRQVMDQVLQLAGQSGVTGQVSPSQQPEAPEEAEPVEEPLPPHHQEAYDAIERGDYAAAISAYKTAIAQNPSDAAAAAGLAQVNLLARLQNADPGTIRANAASDPKDVDAALSVADLDVSGGHVDDAFDRLLALFGTLDAAGKETVRGRILEYFEIVGSDDPRVTRARARLASLLY